jgi:hypothetical protein
MTSPTRTPRPRLPAFHPVPVRARSDGWTPWRQAEFIGVLAETGSVSAAAAFVGMARETAYRLRRKAGAEEFARAWDVALALAGKNVALARTHLSRKVTARPCWQQVVDGNWRPVLRRGKYAATVHKPDNSGLLSHMAQIDRSFRAQRKELRAELRSQTKKGDSASTRPAIRGGAAPGRLAAEATGD